VFDDPDRFDIRRRTSASVPFGRGRYACLAQHLARLQGEVMLGTIVRRLPALRFAPSGIEWDTNLYLRSMKRFEVEL
jgi:cytochrome P450